MTKYITNQDRYNYWPDKQDVTVYAMIGQGTISKFDHLNWKQNKKDEYSSCYKLPCSNRVISFRKDSSFLCITVYLKNNFNRMIRDLLKRKFNIQRLEAVSFPTGNNFVHPQLIDLMDAHGITREDVLGEADIIFWNDLDEIKSEISLFIRETLKIDLGKWELRIKHSLRTIEIGRDIRCAPNEELSKNKDIIRQFKRQVLTFNTLMDNGNGQLSKTDMVRCGEQSGSVRKMIIGYYRDGSCEKLYFKMSCKRGSLNRTERVFKGKKVICAAADRTHVFTSLEDYQQLVQQLMNTTFIGQLKIYDIVEDTSEEARYKKLKGYCQELFGRFGIEAFRSLKVHGCIWTSSKDGSPAYRSIARKTPSLAASGILFRKSGRGRYVVDWDYVMSGRPMSSGLSEKI